MNKIEVNWNEEEFKTYVLLYAANADFNESEEEKRLIESKIDSDLFMKIHREFDTDSDYDKVQKIQKYLDLNKHTKEDINKLFEEIKGLFMSDGQFDVLERNLFMGLKKILI